MPLTDAEIERIWRWKTDELTTADSADTIQVYAALADARADAALAAAGVAQLTAKVDALGLTLGDDEAHIIAAIRTAGAPGPTDVAALAAALAPALVAAMPADSTPEQMADAVLKAMAAHLGSAT